MAIGAARWTVVAGAVDRTLLVLRLVGRRRHRLHEVGQIVNRSAELQGEDHQQGSQRSKHERPGSRFAPLPGREALTARVHWR